ncbi:flagellar biosynthesis sigma factor [Trinickia terrae]|uniref:Flagellar biosynthesis sigma factor n=2 Tax=Trinickia terrae TaxID=2571161 RepID=A0A4U1I0X3_9BURK|nr:flagellar biosynthesis sigma factor [Trinickia terrae]
MLRGKIRRFGYTACTLFGCAVVWGIYAMTKPVDEVVLTLGEPYEQVRQHSRSTLPVATEDNSINLYVRRPAVFRFRDPQFGFVTPPARFLSLYADQLGNVSLVTLSPQVETLPLDESMDILTDLQNQFRRKGWKPFHSRDTPPIEDTQATRNAIRTCTAPTTRWHADDKYQVSLNIRCFRTDDRANDERYLITLDLSFSVFENRPDD